MLLLRHQLIIKPQDHLVLRVYYVAIKPSADYHITGTPGITCLLCHRLIITPREHLVSRVFFMLLLNHLLIIIPQDHLVSRVYYVAIKPFADYHTTGTLGITCLLCSYYAISLLSHHRNTWYHVFFYVAIKP